MIAFPRAMPVHGVLGGLLIGLASALMLLGNGHVAGVSGMFARAIGLAHDARPRLLALAFVAGLPVGAIAVTAMMGVASTAPTSPPLLAIAGVLVGFGTRLGSGCTSGHGVCGLSRLAPRSIAATLVFMGAGMLTVGALRLGGAW